MQLLVGLAQVQEPHATMSRARFTQKDIERALRGAKEAGVNIEIRIEGTMVRILPYPSNSAEEEAAQELKRWVEEDKRRKARARSAERERDHGKPTR